MAITKMEESRTFAMLSKDKRVRKIEPEVGDCVVVLLAPGWLSGGDMGNTFNNWEAARNWVRRAVNVEVDA